MKELSQVSHYLGETAIRIDCNQLGKILTQTQTYLRQDSLGHVWYNLGTHVAGSISAAQLGTNQLLGCSGLAYPWAHV